MSVYAIAFERLMELEGEKFVNHPDDKGGPTKFGWTLKSLLQVNPEATVATLQALTRQDAAALYREHFWDRYRCGEIKSQAAATKFFTNIAWMGPGDAAFRLQLAHNLVTPNEEHLEQDGIAGSKTIAAVNRLPDYRLTPAHQLATWDHVLARMDEDESQRSFERGWERRAFDQEY